MFTQHICLHIKPLTYVTQRPTDANTQIIILRLLSMEGPQTEQTGDKLDESKVLARMPNNI